LDASFPGATASARHGTVRFGDDLSAITTFARRTVTDPTGSFTHWQGSPRWKAYHLPVYTG